MPTKIELQFAAAVQQAVANVKKVEGELQYLSGDAKSASGALANIAAAGNSMGAAGAAVAAGMQIARTGLAAAAQASQFLTAELALLTGAFNMAYDAAEKYGNVKVTTQIDQMKQSVDNAVGALVSLPIAGRSVLDWMGDAAAGAGNLALLVAALEIKWKEFTGEIDASTAAMLTQKLATDGATESMSKYYDSAKAAQDALKQMRIEQNDVMAGYRVYTVKRGGYNVFEIRDAQGNTVDPNNLPGRAAGGPVQAGRAYTVGERGPETLVMGNQSGTIIPNGGAVGNTVVVNVSVNAGAFLGDRADAIRLAQQLAPEIERAARRSVR